MSLGVFRWGPRTPGCSLSFTSWTFSHQMYVQTCQMMHSHYTSGKAPAVSCPLAPVGNDTPTQGVLYAPPLEASLSSDIGCY